MMLDLLAVSVAFWRMSEISTSCSSFYNISTFWQFLHGMTAKGCRGWLSEEEGLKLWWAEHLTRTHNLYAKLWLTYTSFMHHNMKIIVCVEMHWDMLSCRVISNDLPDHGGSKDDGLDAAGTSSRHDHHSLWDCNRMCQLNCYMLPPKISDAKSLTLEGRCMPSGDLECTGHTEPKHHWCWIRTITRIMIWILGTDFGTMNVRREPI